MDDDLRIGLALGNDHLEEAASMIGSEVENQVGVVTVFCHVQRMVHDVLDVGIIESFVSLMAACGVGDVHVAEIVSRNQ